MELLAVPLDVTWASDGYLILPDGHGRHFYGVGQLVRFGLMRDVTFYWAWIPGGRLGHCYCWTRRVILSPVLLDREPVVVRDCIGHELGHAISGPSCQRARYVQARLWPEGEPWDPC